MTKLRDAATVIILRANREPFELFMLRRHSGHEFMPNAWVFPGGSLDKRDMTDEVFDCVDDLDRAEARRRMGDRVDEETALGLYVAAVRETFEESGLLLATRPGEKGYLSLTDPETIARAEKLRLAVDAADIGMAEVCDEFQVRLSGADFGFFAHWVTPDFESRRYDTRFFITRAPRNQTATHDDGETTRGAWVTPQMAIERYRLGELLLAPPTLQTLEDLATFSTIDEVLEAVEAAGVPPRILPELLEGEEELTLVLPGEESRMIYRDGQWVIEDR